MASTKINIGSTWIRLIEPEKAIQAYEDRIRGRALLNLGIAAWQLERPEAAALVQEALEWYAGEGKEVYTPIEVEAVAQDFPLRYRF